MRGRGRNFLLVPTPQKHISSCENEGRKKIGTSLPPPELPAQTSKHKENQQHEHRTDTHRTRQGRRHHRRR